MREIRPTVIVGVPRVYEKIRQAVEQKAAAVADQEASAGVGRPSGLAHLPTSSTTAASPSSFSWKLANKLVYSKVGEAFGGRVRIFVSGGAPLGIDTAQMVRLRRHRAVGGLRPHRNFAGDCAQHARCATAWAPSACRSANVELKLGRRRRASGSRSVGLRRLLAKARGDCRVFRQRRDGSAPAISRTSTPTAFFTSPIARRSC